MYIYIYMYRYIIYAKYVMSHMNTSRYVTSQAKTSHLHT